MRQLRRGFLLGATVVAIMIVLNLFLMPAALAQEERAKQEVTQKEYELEAMTVTAEKREENIQEVPVSITAISNIQIEDSGIVSIEEVALQIPNLHLPQTGDRHHSYFYIRGIGSVSMNEPVVGFYVDDVNYLNWGCFDTELFDIDRIEVLRGPQGTLYGRNTLGGVINIITKKPENQWEGKASGGYGNYNRQVYRAAIRGPLVKEKLFLGLSGVKNERDGFADNTYLGTEPDDRDGKSGRAHLRWLPTDAWDITLSANSERLSEGASSLAPLEEARGNPHKVSYNYDGYMDNDTNGQSLRIVYKSPWFDVTSVTARSDWECYMYGDFDHSAYDVALGGIKYDQDQFTQEIRLASAKDSPNTLKWLAGAYYFNEDLDNDLIYDIHSPTPMKSYQLSELDNKGYAIFGQATYTLFEKLGLTAGLRYDHESREMDWKAYTEMMGMTMPIGELDVDDDWDEWLPKFVIDYQWTPELMTYASMSKGFRSGGFNFVISDPSYVSFDPEYSWNYELGLKSSWLDNRLIVNMAAFYIQWKDQQLGRYISATEHVIYNAGESYSQGFEVEMISRPARGLEFVAGFGYTDVKFEDYKDDLSGEIYDDNRIPYAPKYTYNLAAQYRHASGIFGRLELQGVGEVYFDAANTEKESGYQLVNARIGYEWEHFDLYLWGKNLFDKEYIPWAFDATGAGDWFGHSGDPLIFGITLAGRF